MQALVNFLQALWDVIILVAFGAAPIEQTFKDPVTGKSGKYTVAFTGNSSAGLLVFFHGSGNTSGYAGVFPDLEKVAYEYNLVPLALQAPDSAITWADGANGPSNQHVAYAKSFLEREIFLKHPEVKRDRLILVGFSAGSTFLSGDFLPRVMGSYQGGAVLLCGGGGPLVNDAAIFRALSDAEAKAFPLYFLIQTKDFLYPQTMQGIGYWRSRKARVTAETPEGGGHCAFDMPRELRKGLKALGQIPL